MASATYAAPALVISECQRGILDPQRSVVPDLADQAADRAIVGRIATLAGLFRARGLPVVHCIIEHRADQLGLVPNSYLSTIARRRHSMTVGTPDTDIPNELGPEPDDFISSRAYGLTAFYGTNLDATLRLMNVRTLIVAGVSTNIAVPGLTLEAVNRGYDVVVAEDCTAGASPTTHEFMLTNIIALPARIQSSTDIAGRLPSGRE